MIPHNDPDVMQLLEQAYSARGTDQLDALRRRIAQRPADEQADWLALIAEITALRTAMNEIELPEGLEERLLKIPKTRPAAGWRKLANVQLRGWQAAAAVLLALGIGLSVLWPRQPLQPPRPQLLSDALAQRVASIAVENHDQAPPLETITDDPSRAAAALEAHDLSFPAQVPHPGQNWTLDGAGTASFAGKLAAFTRWHGQNVQCTLYQFDAKAMRLPANFLESTADAGTPPRKVLIWPGADGACGWALVSSAPLNRNPFIGGY